MSNFTICNRVVGRAAFLIMCILLAQLNSLTLAQAISTADLERIGRRIWQNECNGSVRGLTSWNSGEDFASLGIGHFIWYPAGQSGPFEESFPRLLEYYRQAGVTMPAWLQQTRGSPWTDRASFQRDHASVRQQELRDLLARTVAAQTQFIIARLDAAVPRMQAAAGRSSAHVAKNMQLLRTSAAGNFAMIDYVNFKGEGLQPSERYNGEGWGLLQVLMEMQPCDASSAPRAFANAAKRVLARRVKNSPPARKEQQWLQGWSNRCETYAR
ncbi:MAG: hypothetical protein ACR2IE_08180 [Candidatus Sumerlaeaceae bacterium]